MILIADSGSTKTEWTVSEDGQERQRITTRGMNPYFESWDDIRAELLFTLFPDLNEGTYDAIYFYGAGCTGDMIPPMQRTICSCISAVKTEAASDMLGAARGLCGQEAGIACILGTGSNSCFYDGEKITASVSPLGFILGDEGSGAAMGKTLVGDLLKNQLPAGLKEKFLAQYELTPSRIIEKVYRQPFPNRFLAGLSSFLADNTHIEAVRAIVKNAFTAFLRRNVSQYDYAGHPVHFTGSVAWYYREILAETLRECGMEAGTIVQSPLAGLVKYHAEKRKPDE